MFQTSPLENAFVFHVKISGDGIVFSEFVFLSGVFSLLWFVWFGLV